MASDTVEFSAHVPRSEYDFFKENFEQYGAVKWFINSALREFNDRVRQEPLLREQVSASIENMLETSRLIAQAAGGEASNNPTA